MGIFNIFKKKQEEKPEVYTEKQLDQLEEYIVTNFGEFKNVIHEIVSPDIHVDIAVIEPNESNDFYRLVTMGMGAHKMNVPPPWDSDSLHHAELVIHLPKEWNITSDDENDYWPIRWLKIVARLPIDCDTWLGYGHTIASGNNHETLSNNNLFEGIALVHAMDVKNKAATLVMDNNKTIRFYQLVPLYGEEMEYKTQQEDIDKLLEKFDEKDLSFVVDINRKRY